MTKNKSGSESDRETWGLLAEFTSEDEIMNAAKEVRSAGFSRWDCHVPYPVHGLDKAMGVKTTILPWLVFFCGAAGATVGYLMQYWMNAVDYQYLISGKPFHSAPSQIPVTFELTILFSAFGAFFGSMAMNGLPKFFSPLFRSERFRRVTDDRFFVCIEAADEQFSGKTREFLQSLGASSVEELKE